MNDTLADQHLHAVKINEELRATRGELEEHKTQTQRAMDLGRAMTASTENTIFVLEAQRLSADNAAKAAADDADSIKEEAAWAVAQASTAAIPRSLSKYRLATVFISVIVDSALEAIAAISIGTAMASTTACWYMER